MRPTPTVGEPRMPGAPLSLPEREEISVALIENPTVPWAHIARLVDRHPTTIARDVTANGGRCGYRPALAERAAATARKRPRARLLARAGPLRDRVTAELRDGRSPFAIWADLTAEHADDLVCVETIYASVYARTLEVKPTDCLRTRRTRRRSRLRTLV